MRKVLLALVGFLTFISQAQDNTPIGTWRMHLPYNSVRQVVETSSKLYVLANKGVYSYNLKSGEIIYLTKIDGFAETEVERIAFSEEYNTLVIGYKNANIDLLKGNTIINLPGVLRSSIVGVKTINDIKIYDGLAYLSCSFGVVVIDLEREEIKDDYQNLGDNGAKLSVASSAILNDTLYLGTPDGLLYAPANDPQVNLKNFSSYDKIGNFDSVFLLQDYNNKLYIADNLFLYDYANGTINTTEGGNAFQYESMVVSHDELIVCKFQGIITINNAGVITDEGEPFYQYAVKDKDNNLWFGAFAKGLVKKTPAGDFSFLTPNGPFDITTFEMKAKGTEMWTSSGGHTTAYAPTYNNAGYYRYQNGTWTNKDATNVDINTMRDFTAILFDEETGDEWFGSFGTGLLHMNKGQFVERYETGNSALSNSIGSGTTVLGLAMDSKKNLWMSNYETERALVVRRADGTWQDFLVGTKRLGEMIVDEYDQVWASIPRDGSRALLVFSEKDGIIRSRILAGGARKGNLPNNNIKAIVLDKDGEIWVGTETGIAVFYNPGLVFDGSTNGDAQQIIIDDGNDIGYLLGSEVVNDLKVDGANRKWAATNNGVWLISPDGSEIIKHFTTSNSPLPNNVVNTLEVVPLTGEVFFGTIDGIVSTRCDATEADDVHSNTLVYPNPVHTDYEGPITITGLPEDATVKIADVAGRVVYELIATGGTAVWNGLNFNGEKPQTGVYLIFTANKDDEDALVSKLLLVR